MDEGLKQEEGDISPPTSPVISKETQEATATSKDHDECAEETHDLSKDIQAHVEVSHANTEETLAKTEGTHLNTEVTHAHSKEPLSESPNGHSEETSTQSKSLDGPSGEPHNTDSSSLLSDSKAEANSLGLKHQSEKSDESSSGKQEPPTSPQATHLKCQVCHLQNTKLSACSACKSVYYCSIQCQKKDWKEHKAACCFVSAKQKQMEEEEAERRRKEALKTKIGDFKLGPIVGTGNFSEICHAIDRRNSQTRAIKIINKMRVKQLRKEKDVLMEKHCLMRLKDNPFVPNLYDTFTDDLSLYIVTDLVDGGELWERVKGFGVFQLSLVKYFMASILKAVASCHAIGIVHRDLKPENILLTKATSEIRLIDFGTARDMQHPEIKGAGNGSTPRRVYEHYIGTPNYMAPECIRNKDSNYKSDVYSLGSLFFQLFTGFPAYTGPSEYLIFKVSLEQKPPSLPGVIPEEAYELICLMTEKDFNKRISITEAMQHRFFAGVDFENILPFSEAAKIFRPVERILSDLKEKITKETKLTLPELERLLKEGLDDQKTPIEGLEEEERKEFEMRLQFLKRQLKHYFEIQEIEFFKF